MLKTRKGILRLLPLSGLLLGVSAFAQTTTPGTPTTALGGDWVFNILLLAVGVILVGVGAAMYRQKRESY